MQKSCKPYPVEINNRSLRPREAVVIMLLYLNVDIKDKILGFNKNIINILKDANIIDWKVSNKLVLTQRGKKLAYKLLTSRSRWRDFQFYQICTEDAWKAIENFSKGGKDGN